MLEVPCVEQLSSLIRSCSSDLRRSLLTLQFLAQSASNVPPSTSKNLNETEPNLPSSQLFDSLYYSHLAERCDESILRPIFDDLVRKPNAIYEQSHSFMMHQRKNETQR